MLVIRAQPYSRSSFEGTSAEMTARLIEKVFTFVFDVFAISVAFFTTFWLRYWSGLFPETYNPALEFSGYLVPMAVLGGAWIVLFFLTGLYRDWYKESRLDEFFVVSRTVLFGIFLLFLMISADELIAFAKTGSPPTLLSRTQVVTLFTYGGCMLFFATGIRFTMHTILGLLFSRGIGVSNVLIIGATVEGAALARDIDRYPHLGYTLRGFVDDDGRKKGAEVEGKEVLGTYSDLPHIIKRENISGIIISHVSTSANEILKIVNYCGEARVTVYMVPTLIDVITGHLKTHQLFGVPLMVLLQDHMPAWQAQIKRLMDIVVSSGILLLGAPLWLLTALAIKLTSKGPAVFRQERIGRNGKPFIMMKFRSMYQDAEKRTGPVWATEDDPRITPLGKFLRKTRLDEIPQFINVLKGEMSLVGPRPERAYFIEQLRKEIPWYVRRIKMKPGITGWAQVKHKYDETIEDVKQKVLYDLYYFENMSIGLDIKIIVRTLLVVFTGKGAH
ncbi:MAG: exopolysaccharide biosynthesis polyprenyl glycosylphosphotransferase [Chitinivibrionales bacterium]|nr:exopolysaccharide biosynthesis polyprenyl glycosylphosphotransferase [Chitinivibrionales bacterium]MBD3358939.1 exopolysaccharide biosynthesis polyprenyl glycosylphosphotransferase [Chitinivibrionales bacterium]